MTRPAPPEPPEGMLSLAQLIHAFDPTGNKSKALINKIERMTARGNPLITLEALTVALIRLIEDAPDGIRDVLGTQLAHQLSRYFKKHLN